MIKWIKENAVIFSLATSAVIFISGAAVAYHQLSGVVANQSVFESHINDTTRHLDPTRDPEARRQLLERVEKLEERVIRLESRRGRRADDSRSRNR